MLTCENSMLILVDVQEKLTQVMYEREQLIERLAQLVKGVRLLGLPVLWMEQYPQGLGPTVPALQEHLQAITVIEKRCFSCWDSPAFREALENSGRDHLLLCGIEAHVCIYQTARDLITAGLTVDLVADGVSSRSRQNREIGIERIRSLGAGISSVEMALFELLRVAEGDAFKAISKLIK